METEQNRKNISPNSKNASAMTKCVLTKDILNHSLHLICKNCLSLQIRIKQLERTILKLNKIYQNEENNLINKEGSPKPKKLEKGGDNKMTGPKQLRYSYDIKDIILQKESKLLLSIQEKAKKLCLKEKKQRSILKKIIQSNQNTSATQSLFNKNEEKMYQSLIDSSKPVLSPIKMKGVKFIRTESLNIQNLLREKSRILSIPSSILIEDIPNRGDKNKNTSCFLRETPENGINFELMNQFLDDSINQTQQSKERQERNRLNSSSCSGSRFSHIFQLSSSQQVDKHYKKLVQKGKMMAKIKRKK